MTIETRQNIRTAQIEDSPNLALLASKAFVGYPFEYVFEAEGITKAIQDGERRYVMINENNQTIGSAVLGINNTKMAEIMRVMIDPSLRKNGAATSLTRVLSLDAIKLEKYSWADVRGDQIGMQRAALGAGLRAISLEQGKHVVYKHMDENGNDLGPARETMVHMTTLPIDELSLKQQISKLTGQVREQLVTNLKTSLNPELKDKSLSEIILPSASKTKYRILNNIELNSQDIDFRLDISTDILKISVSDVDTIVVLPDASAFIQKGTQLIKTVDLLAKIGVQVITYYCDINNHEQQDYMINCGFTASTIRPWVDEQTGNIVWQISWRKTSNDYQYCLHSISLDRIVERQIMKIINIIEK